MVNAISYIADDLKIFRVPLRLNLVDLFVRWFLTTATRHLEKAHLECQGALKILGDDTYPLPGNTHREFIKAKERLRKLEEALEDSNSPKLYSFKTELSSLVTSMEELSGHIVNREELDETEYLEINKANKAELERAMASQDYKTLSAEETES